jgi:hypothetical protein
MEAAMWRTLIPLSLLLSACAPSDLEGDWEGSLDCGDNAQPDMEVEIDETDEDDLEYEARGIFGLVGVLAALGLRRRRG